MTITAEKLIQEEGVEAGLRDLGDQVRAAEKQIIKLVTEDPKRVWTIRELQDAAAEAGDWTSSVVSIAYRRLVRSGTVLEVGSDLRVRAI